MDKDCGARFAGLGGKTALAWVLLWTFAFMLVRPLPAAAADGTITLSTDSMSVGYTQPISVTATGVGTDFVSNGTTVTLLNNLNQSVGDIQGVTVASATSLSFAIGTGLAQGSYTVRIAYPTGQASAAFTITGSPSISSLSQSTLGEGYTSAVAMTIGGTNTHWVSGQTQVNLLDSQGNVTGKVSSVSVAGKTSLSFNINTGLTQGSYTLRTVTGGETVTTTFTVTAPPAVTLSISETSAGYSTPIAVTATGARTHFTGSTTVSVLSGNTAVGTASGVTVDTNNQTVSFNIGTGLAQGSYTLSFVTGPETVNAAFTITATATATLSVAEVAQGYTGNVSVSVAGTNTHFVSGQTTVALINSQGNSVGSVTGLSVASATGLSFTIGTGLTQGSYKVRITTGSEKIEPIFTVTAAPTATASPNSAVAGYSSTVSVAVAGTNTHFVSGTTSVQLLKSGSAVGTVSSLTVTNATNLSFGIGTGLSTGTYTIRITTGVEQVDATFTVTEAPTVSLNKTEVSQGYTSGISITASGQRTNFAAGTTTVQVLLDGASVGTVSGTTVTSATQVSFTLGTGLAEGTYTVRFTTNSETVDTTFTVLPAPTISLSTTALATGYSSTEITVTGVNTHFVSGTTSVTVYKNGTATSAATAVTVTNATSLKFTLAAGQAEGSYVVQATSGVETATTSFTITQGASMTISPGSLPTGYQSSSISVTGVGTKFSLGATVSILDGNGVATGTGTGVTATSDTALTFTFPDGLGAGTYTVRVSTPDNTVTTASMTIAVDSTQPAVTATTTPGTTWYKSGQSITVAYSVSDNAAGMATGAAVSATLGGTAVTGLTYTRSTSVSGSIGGSITVPNGLPTGVQNLVVSISDLSGNIGSATVAVNIDNTVPAVTVNSPSGSQTYKKGSTIVVEAAVADPDSGLTSSPTITATVGGTPVSTTGLSFTRASSTKAGTITGTITAPDGLGGQAAVIISVTDRVSNAGSSSANINADTVAPAWSGGTLTVAAATLTSVSLNWSGASDNVGIARYKVYLNGTSIATASGTTYTATGLAQGATYSFQVQAEDAAGNVSTGGPTGSITTVTNTQTLTGNVTAPPASTPFKGGAQVSVSVEFTPITGAPPLGTPSVTATFNGQAASGFSGTVSGSILEVSGSITIPGDLASEDYSLVVQVSDTNGNAGQATTTIKVDTAAPTWAGGAALSQSGVTSSGATITWPAATDDSGTIQNYLVSVNGTQVATVSGSATSYTASGLTASTAYTFSVQAKDVAGNLSASSLSLSLTTSAASAGGTPSTGGGAVVGDTLAPVFSGSLTASDITSTGLTLSWSAATDNVGVAIYTLYQNGALLAEVSGTSYTVAGLEPDTSYTFAITARDAAGNTGSGPTTTVTTPAASGTGSGPAEPAEPKAPPTEPAGSIIKTELKEDGTAALTKVVTADEADVASLVGDLLVSLTPDTVAVSDGETDAEVSSRTAEVPVALLQNLEEARKDVVIDAGVATIEIPPAALTGVEAVSDAAQGGAPVSVKITVEAVDLTKAAAAPAGTAAIVAGSVEKAQAEGLKPAGKVLVLTAAVVTNGQTQQVTKFKQKLTVRIPYEDGVDPNLLGVYRLNRETGKWEYRGGKVDVKAKVVIVQLDGFSEYAVMEFKKSFDDVGSHWAKADIELMAARHIARGMSETSFGPNGSVTRAQFAALLVRALGLPAYTEPKSAFGDVFITDWFYGDVNAAATAGLIKGDQGLFRPNDQITRQEMAVILSRALKLRSKPIYLSQPDVSSLLSVYADSREIAAWARDSAAQLAKAQIISGRAWNQYSPSANATRAEAIVVLKRVLQYLGDL